MLYAVFIIKAIRMLFFILHSNVFITRNSILVHINSRDIIFIYCVGLLIFFIGDCNNGIIYMCVAYFNLRQIINHCASEPNVR